MTQDQTPMWEAIRWNHCAAMHPEKKICIPNRLGYLVSLMFNITITEGLAEIKTIGKRIETKQSQLQGFLYRDARLKDPMEASGGSAKFIDSELQGIGDLQKRIMALRNAIQEANMKTPLQIGDITMTIFQWLVWRREIAPGRKDSLDSMWRALQLARSQAQRGGFGVIAAAAAVQGNSDPKDLIINVDEKALAAEREDLEKVLGELDGRLSLLNATTMI